MANETWECTTELNTRHIWTARQNRRFEYLSTLLQPEAKHGHILRARTPRTLYPQKHALI